MLFFSNPNYLLNSGDRFSWPNDQRISWRPLAPIRNWLNQIDFHRPEAAHFICRLVPSRCPFERTLQLFGRQIHIPALCRINPLYDEIIDLRFRALSYLADVCHHDIRPYLN